MALDAGLASASFVGHPTSALAEGGPTARGQPPATSSSRQEATNLGTNTRGGVPASWSPAVRLAAFQAISAPPSVALCGHAVVATAASARSEGYDAAPCAKGRVVASVGAVA